MGLAQIIKAISQDTGDVIPCSVMLDGEYGQNDLSIGVSVVFGRSGVKDIVILELDPNEQERFRISSERLWAAQKIADQYL